MCVQSWLSNSNSAELQSCLPDWHIHSCDNSARPCRAFSSLKPAQCPHKPALSLVCICRFLCVCTGQHMCPGWERLTYVCECVCACAHTISLTVLCTKEDKNWLLFSFPENVFISVSLVSKHGQHTAEKTRLVEIKVLWLNDAFLARGTNISTIVVILHFLWRFGRTGDVLRE